MILLTCLVISRITRQNFETRYLKYCLDPLLLKVAKQFQKRRLLKKLMAKDKRWIPSDSKSLDDPLNQETLKGVPTNMVSNKIEIWSNDIVVTV